MDIQNQRIMAVAPGLPRQLVERLSSTTDDKRRIVIVAARRSAITRAKKGGFRGLKADQLLSGVLAGLMDSLKEGLISRSDVSDIVIGNCLQPGGGQAMARMAAFEAGFPYSTSVATINRQCSSGLQALATVAGQIKLGVYEVAIAGGVESMSSCSFEGATPIVDWPTVKQNAGAAACTIPMGITSENVAQRFGISRAAMDQFALNSHRKAFEAQRLGHFRDEIVSIQGVTVDDGVRANCSVEALSSLKPAFVANGSTTAGNSSQVSDGAAAVVMTTASTAASLNIPILAEWKSFAVVGVPPDIMGIGPVFAIPEAIRKAELCMSQIDFFDINEAFASQCEFCIRFLGLDPKKCNPLGGSIALGHPLGCTGARQIVSMCHLLRRTGKRFAVVSMCVGSGMGAAAVIENLDYAPLPPPYSKL